jgi:GR25 family glycosyltransferase involved in LPS biosynthesis
MTLCLNMIVKNESHVIEATLTNLLEHVNFDYWVISDTGSTDGTQQMIKDFFLKKNINGELVSHEWKDFGYNRTKALESAYNKTDLLLIFDADDTLHGDFKLPLINCDWYLLHFGTGFKYDRPLLINNRKKWEFKGVLHEFLAPMETVTSSQVLHGNYYIESGKTGNRSQNPTKYDDDAVTLERAYKKELELPDKGLSNRYSFYCAQSYKDSGNNEKAIEWYTLVLTNQNQWAQEKYVSCIQLGTLYKLNQMEKSIHYFLKASEYDIERIEGIIMAIEHFYKTGQHILVNALYHKFKNYTKNFEGKLFVNSELYKDKLEYFNSISAYYVNDKQSSYDCCKQILINQRLGSSELNATIKNMLLHTSFLEKEDTLSLFYAVDELMYKNNFINLDLWNILFKLNREKITKINNKVFKSIKNKKIYNDNILITFTTCKRLHLFKETINSILNHWTDVDLISNWFCVDDNSSKEDRQFMKSVYHWIDYYMKTPEEKGHRKSMNIIWDKLNTLTPKYWIHLEDDFIFHHSMDYITQSIHALSTGISQIVFNRNYAETIIDYRIEGHISINIPNIVLHDHHNESKNYRNAHYWPHYSFRPSMVLVKPILDLGNFDSPNQFFERDYADKWNKANYKTAFFNRITHRHSGRLTSEIGKVANAYDLNNEVQFNPQSNIKVINLERRLDRKQDVIKKLLEVGIQPTFVTAVDGNKLQPSEELKKLFVNNDFGYRKGMIGCALSHLQLWKELVMDSTHNYYVIFEDDITLASNFKSKFDELKPEFEKQDILMLGYHMFSEKREQIKNIYDIVNETIKIETLNDLYIGGFFSYSINKIGAQKLINYIEKNGVRHGIDYLIKIVNELHTVEIQPLIVFSEWNENNKIVDTDIQTNYESLFFNYDQFDFIPNVDQIGNDLYHKSVLLNECMEIALNDYKCVAFNTLGFFKHKIDKLSASFYFKEKDGLYVKKGYKQKTRVKMLCNWCSSEQLCKEWANMYDSTRNIEMVSDDADYFVVINSTHEYYDPARTIVFQMEPWVHDETKSWGVKSWGKWAVPDTSSFLAVRGRKNNCHNNVFWQIELTYSQLCNLSYTKTNSISTVCSSKYFDEGHIARIDLLKFLENKQFTIDIYNSDNTHGFKNYKGRCDPYIDKSKGILPYKYYFMVENNYEKDFITEKLWEPILCESLCFYYGCPNVAEYLNPLAYVVLPIHDFDQCYQIMKTAIEEDWWSQRIEIIKQEKLKILNELAFFPTLQRILTY